MSTLFLVRHGETDWNRSGQIMGERPVPLNRHGVAQAQRFWSVHGVIQNLFRVGRHLLRSVNHRLLRSRSFLVWQEVTCA